MCTVMNDDDDFSGSQLPGYCEHQFQLEHRSKRQGEVIHYTDTVDMTQSQLVCSFQSQGVSKILRACRNFGKVNG